MLEMGVMNYPEEDGSFPHMSGVTFSVNKSIPSSVQLDENGFFVKVDGAYRVVVGARPAKARLLKDEQGLLSGGVTEESAKAFAAFAAETLPTGSNVRGTAEYRTHLIRVLTRRTLMELEG
jgi:CO/xanthine dehydrogenase FAD-binding subunit